MTSRKSTRGVPVASGSGSGSGSGGAHPSSSAASSSRPAAAASSDAPSTDPHLHLLTEHLGFNPRTFIDALVYVANENMYILGGGLEDFVKQHLAAREGGGLESEQVRVAVPAERRARDAQERVQERRQRERHSKS
jgi:kinetochore protein Mis12/MTW1